MAMTPSDQAIVGGTVLRIPAIQSPNYVPGVSGWIIRQDGSAEFNTGTFRGSIEVGSLTGQHFWVNNPSTGDVIDVYNSSNQLVFSIDSTGRLASFSAASTTTVVVNGGALFFEDTAETPQLSPQEQGLLSPTITTLLLGAGVPASAAGGVQEASLALNTGTTQASTWIESSQRGISGAVLQTDSGTNANQLIHTGIYSGTTDANGHLIFSHLCNFTPVGAIITGRAPAVGTFPNLTLGTDGFTSTLANVSFIIANTNVVYANSAVMINALFWG